MAATSGLNTANYNNCVSWNSLQGNVVGVGQNGDPSYWGTYDQGGNVLEWTEEQTYLGGNNEYAFSKVAYGGSWKSSISSLSNTNYGQFTRPGLNDSNLYNSLNSTNENGFRVFSYTNPLNISNFVTVSGYANEGNNVPNGNIYGIDKYNKIWRLQPDSQQVVEIMSTGLSFPTGSNAIAYNDQTNHLIFMYYGTSSLPFGSPNNNGSGLYSVKISYDDNNTPKLTNITGINNWNNYISKPIYNASYWNNASGSGGYWYMSEATGILSKIAFTTQGSGLSIVPTSFKSFTLTVPVLPNLYDNQFGDISISGSSSSGYLYATTRFGFLYCFNLTPTMIGQNPVYVTGMKITGDAAGKTLQTTFNNSNNILYGHHYDTQTWYTIDTNLDSFGNTNIIKSTSDQNVILPQFTDMCGGTSCTVGSVATGYKVSSYAVTNQEYVNFLNSVDPSGLSTQLTPYDNGYGQNSTASTGILYTYLMSSDRGGVLYVANNLLGNKYTVKKYMDTKPAVFITWPMAARYCNWLHNRVSDPHSNINTNGAYNFNAVSYDGGLSSNTGLIRNQNAKYFLPNIHEWYKSAYYSLNKNPSGYNLYATQSDSPPTCIEADEYGEGPHWINDVKQVIFNDLSVGDSYTLYLSITKPSKYDAFLTTTVIEFKANKTSEKILIPITRYSTVLAIILTTKLVNNAGRVVDERNHLVACPGINTGCLARLPRTPLPTSTVTPSITATVTRTPSGTRQPSTPTPTNTVTKTGTPTPSVTSTITPSVTVTSSKPQSIIYACNFVDSSNNYDIMSGTYNKQSDSEYRKDNNLTGYKIYYNGSNSRWELANNAGTAFYYASSIFGVWRSTSAVTQYPADSVGFWQVATSPCSDRDTFV